MDVADRPATNYLIPTGERDVARMHSLNATFDDESMNWIEAEWEVKKIRFLDVGCGPGELTIKIARALGDKSQVVGIDASAEQLAVAQRQAEKLGVRNIQWVQKDVYDLKDYKNQFDVVHCRFLLSHLKNVPEAIKNMAASVNKHGMLIMEELTSNDFVLLPEEPFCFKAWKGLIDLQHLIQGSNIGAGEALYDIAKGIGFTDIRVNHPSLRACTAEQKGFLPLVIDAAKARVPNCMHSLLDIWQEALAEIQNDENYTLVFDNFIQIKASR
jgi:SAM-dependent methyltransferase